MNPALYKFCTTGDTNALRDIDETTKDIVLEAAKTAIDIYAFSESRFYRLAALAIDAIGKPPDPPIHFTCDMITPLEWVGDSCYADSVLVALLCIPNNFVDNTILGAKLSKLTLRTSNKYPCSTKSREEDLRNRMKVQKELRRIAMSMRGESSEHVQSCSDLRNLLKECPHPQNYHKPGQADAGEYLEYLLTMFPDTNQMVQKSKEETSTDGGKTYTQKNAATYLDNNSVFWYVNNNFLTSFTNPTVRDLLVNIDTQDHENKITRKSTQVISAPYLIITLDRLDSTTGNVKYTPVQITENLTFYPFGRTLTLLSVVLWQNRHYTCAIKCDSEWWYYDDNDTEIEYIGSFEDLLETQDIPRVSTNSTILFYG